MTSQLIKRDCLDWWVLENMTACELRELAEWCATMRTLKPEYGNGDDAARIHLFIDEVYDEMKYRIYDGKGWRKGEAGRGSRNGERY